MVKVLSDSGVHDVETADHHDHLWISESELEGVTGWTLKPEGLCRGDVCVPIPPGLAAEFVDAGRVDVARFWGHLGQPSLHEPGAWYLGEGAAERSRALESLEAPDFTLPDLDGRLHSLSEHRGKKVFLATWASW